MIKAPPAPIEKIAVKKHSLLPRMIMPVLPMERPVRNPPPNSRFYHSGDLGDIIYSLAAIKAVGGGDLILGPEQRSTLPAREPIRRDKFDLLAPLLKAQGYVKNLEYAETYPLGATDLNQFRSMWNETGVRKQFNITTLVEMHCHFLKALDRFNIQEAWVSVDKPSLNSFYIVHRSVRYRATGQDAFPWASVLSRFRGQTLFVGLPAEHEDFTISFGVRIPFYATSDFFDLGKLIAGSRGFIGNQSFPCALALALNVPVLQESWPQSRDCILGRPNFLTQPFSGEQLDKWSTPVLLA